MSARVFFPYGISNIDILTKDDYVFVDKTHFVEKLETEKERNVCFLRPRKFGKSLWLSVLEYYYDINQKDKFNKIFGKYYIGEHSTPLKNSYRILKFDFSGIDTSSPERARQGFNNKVQSSLYGFGLRYKVFDIKAQEYIREATHEEEKIARFFELYPKDIPVYLLFDEYDHFTNELLYQNKQNFIESVSKQGYVRKFFEVVKTATQQGIVDRMFVTGVSPVTLDALTSGFNIIKHLTHNPNFEVMLGFTEDEVKYLLNLVLQDKSREDEIMQEMQEWYNGYKFSPKASQTIYNSDMVLYYLDNFKDNQEPPMKLLDPNIAPDYGKLKQMFNFVNISKNEEVLKEVLEKGHIDTGLMAQFNLERGFGKKEFINFLAYMGNLTIKKSIANDIVAFGIPNRVIADLYWQYYADVLQEKANLEYEADDVLPAVLEMALHGQYHAFFGLVQKLLKNLSNRDFIRFDEKNIKMVIVAYLAQANIFYVASEQEMQNKGYVDLLLLKKPNTSTEHHQYAIELKYLKTEEKDKLTQVQEQAKQQVLSYYQQDERLHNKKMLHLLTVVAVKDELYVQEINL